LAILVYGLLATLPLFPTMGEEDVKGVVGAMKKVVGGV
jgi:dTDP-4-amino-4,6-dideoxygalactose transaminase